MSSTATLYLVGRGPGKSLRSLFLPDECPLTVIELASSTAFLASETWQRPACAVVLTAAPDPAGGELLLGLRARDCRIPVIIGADRAGVRDAVTAMQHGAFWFFQQERYDPDAVRAAVQAAVRADARRWDREVRRNAWEEKLARLSSQERQVCEMLQSGATRDRITALLETTSQTLAGVIERIGARMEVHDETQLLVGLLQFQLECLYDLRPATSVLDESPGCIATHR